MNAPLHHSDPSMALIIGHIGFPFDPERSPTDKVSDLVNKGEFAHWLYKQVFVESDRYPEHKATDVIAASNCGVADGEYESIGIQAIGNLTESERLLLMAQVDSTFSGDISDEVWALLPHDGSNWEDAELQCEDYFAPSPPAFVVTPLDNFDWYEGAGVPTPCRDAEHALSVAKGILERSLAHEHAQAKDPASAEELFSRWDDFGDYPSISPKLDPPFDPSECARQRVAEICRAYQAGEASIKPEHYISPL